MFLDNLNKFAQEPGIKGKRGCASTRKTLVVSWNWMQLQVSVKDQVRNTFRYIRRSELHYGQVFQKSGSTELRKGFGVRGT